MFLLALIMLALTPAQIAAVFASDDYELQRLVYAATTHPYYTFEPRPDQPDQFDEQSSFVGDGKSKFSILLGGTGSGKTVAAGWKTANYVLTTPPPRDRCPFWIVGESFDQVCQAGWVEKLSQFIPASEIHSIQWYRSKRQWPYAVMLRRPEPDRRNEVGWILEFKSYEQGLSGMKAVSIGGYWCNEEIPYHLLFEIQGRCRDYDSPGWADFTPIECKDPEWPEAYENPPDGWRFYHLNSMLNEALPIGFMERYLASVPEDMRELRQIGKFTVLRGQVFKEWRKAVHVIKPFRIPPDWYRIRAMDFGFNNPFCCLWIARDRDGRYYAYKEHFEGQRLNSYHAAKINAERWDDNDPHYGPTYSDHDAQQRAEFAELGIHCTPANKSINAGIQALRELMMVQADGKPRFYVFENCVNLIRELPSQRWPDGSSSRNPADTPLDLNNHAVDAVRYGVYSDLLSLSAGHGFEGRHVARDASRLGVRMSNGHSGRSGGPSNGRAANGTRSKKRGW